MQEAEESFDLALVAALEIDVVPYLGDPRVPDYIISQLAKVLQQGSCIREAPEYRPPSPTSPGHKSPNSSYDLEKIESFGDVKPGEGTTEPGRFLPRERFAYWCFDLLFLVCSDTAKGTNSFYVCNLSVNNNLYLIDRINSRRRVAALALPAVLSRCRTTLTTFVADEALRGSLPFSR